MQYFPTYNKFSLYMQYWLYYIVYLHKHDQLSYESLCIVSTQEFVVYVIFFVGALFASLRNHHNKVIPLPTGMGKVMINISFCFSCFCFCICCSQRCRAKTLQIIILFSFMSFIYHIINPRRMRRRVTVLGLSVRLSVLPSSSVRPHTNLTM